MSKKKRNLQSVIMGYSTIVFVLPLLVIAVLSLLMTAESLVAGAKTENSYLLRAVTGKVEEYIRNVEEDAGFLLHIAGSNDPGAMDLALLAMQAHRRDLFKIQITDNNGFVTHLIPNENDFHALDMSGQSYFRYPMASGNDYWSPVRFSSQLGRPAISYSLPLNDGVLTFFISLDPLLKDIEKLFPNTPVEVFITDQNGVYIVHKQKVRVDRRERLADFGLLRNEFRGRPLEYEAVYDEYSVLGAVSFVSDSGWLVFTGRNSEVINAPIRQYTLFMVIQLSFVLALSILLSVFMSRRFTKPLVRLKEESERISHGDYSSIEVQSTIFEIDTLTNQLNAAIMEIKNREISILARERRFALMFNNNALGAIVLNDKLEIFRVNERWADILNRKSADILDRGIGTGFSKETAKLVHKALDDQIVNPAKVQTFELPLLEKDRWVKLYISCSLGDELLVLVLAEDISERVVKEAENTELRESMNLLIDALPFALFTVNKDAEVINYNSFTKQYLAKTPLKSSKSVGNLLPGFAKHVSRMLGDLSDKTHETIDKLLIEIDKQAFYFSVTGFSFTVSGQTVYTFIFRDITKRMNMEEMMIQSEKMLSVGGLAAGMAHEINNPLGGIMQGVQVVQKRLFEDLSKNLATADEIGLDINQMREYLDKRGLTRTLHGIMESGQRASDIVSSMLSFSRKDYSGKTMHKLASLVDQTIDLAASDYDLKKQYDFRKINIIREYDTELPDLSCEATKIQQVILNLLKNGAQAMAEAATPNPQFKIRTFSENHMQYVTLEDNGPGIPDHVRKRIFEPFYTTKEPGIGTGLGLAVSYFIIAEQHNGQLYVENVAEGGSRFIVGLPE